MNLTEAGKRIHQAATKKLNFLDLSECRRLQADTFRQLNIRKLARHLRILNLSGCNLDADAAVAISDNLTNLTHLYLSYNNIGDVGAIAIAQKFRKLGILHIDYNNIGDVGAMNIAQNLKKLTKLSINSNNIGDIGGSAIAQNLHNLTHLYIGNNGLGELGAAAIAENLHNLLQLDIGSNNIKELGAVAVAQNLRNLSRLDIRSNYIGDMGAAAIAQNLHSLSQLDIRSNNIGEMGATAIAQNLRNLSQLDIRSNGIGEMGGTAIAQNLHSLSHLDISSNNIGDEAATMIAKHLVNLAQLHMCDNYISHSGTTAIAQNLHNLTYLDISTNKIGARGATVIAQYLQNLKDLDISSNKIGEAGAKAIGQNLQNLEGLNISTNEIGDIGTTIIARNMSHLAKLYISENDIGEVGAREIAQNLHNLNQLDISSNNIGNIGAIVIANNLRNLTHLFIHSNSIGNEGATAIAHKLRYLTLLYINDNRIGDAGATAISQNLYNLTHLYISYNNIGDKGLKALALSSTLRNSHIFISSNQPQAIPRETANHITTLRAYFNASQHVDLIVGNVVRIVLCGNTRAGKTSLATKLKDINLPNPKEDDRTHGIRHWSIQKTVNKKDYCLNIWDFGGQDYYHATHAASLSTTDRERDNQLSLYLLVWRQSKPSVPPGSEEEAFQQFGEDYWLGFIHLLAGSPSITLVQTHTDADTPAFPKSRLIQQGPFVLSPNSFRHLSLDDKHILSKDGQAQWRVFYDPIIASAIQKIEESAEKIPATWQQLRQSFIPDIAVQYSVIHRNELEKLLLAAPFLRRYNDIPAALGYIGLLSYLKGCGDILYWNEVDHPLYETVVLNIQQFHKDLYETLLNDKVQKAGGQLQPEQGFEFHISYLLHHGLIFEKQESPGTYVAPQYLPAQPLIAHFKQLIPRTLTLRFPHYMPRYLITRCIVQVYGQKPKNTDYWKYGCISEWQKGDTTTHFMVAINPDAEKHDVHFYIKDTSNKFELLRKLYVFFASFGTIDIWKDTNVKRAYEEWEGLVSLSGKEAVSEGKHHQMPGDISGALQLSTDGELFAEVQEIQKAIKDKQYSVRTIDNRYTKLNTIMQQLVDPNAKTPKKIFFSYSRYEREYLEEFKVHFATLRRQGLIETWFDGQLDAGEDANAGIMKELVNSDIIICLLSPRFMANDYIWHIEMEKAKVLKKTIVPITIKRCDYKGYFADFFGEDKQGLLTQKQFDVENIAGKTLKHDVIWIGSETHEAKRDEYYAFIIDELKKIILK